jgi:hypothetical protein
MDHEQRVVHPAALKSNARVDQDQGIRSSGCFRCKLLYPDSADPCSECGNSLAFIPAQMLCEDSVRQRVRDEVRALQAEVEPARRRERLLTLLHSMFVYGGVAVAEAGVVGAGIPTLRREYEAT